MLTRLLVIAILVAWGGTLQGQSLGEAAAKEKERRAKLAGSPRSYTDSDLRDAASKRAKEGDPRLRDSPPPSVAPTSSKSPGPPVAEDSAGSTDLSQSDALKKSRGAEYKARLAEVNSYLKDAEEDLRAANKDWNMVSSHPWELASVSDKVRSRLETAKERVELLRRQRDDIEDAARREGIPPGYLR